MAISCGVDFHPRQHSVSYCDPADGEIRYREFQHEGDDFRGFYSRLTGEVIVGLVASGYSAWFEQLLAGLGHQVWLGDASGIRRRAKRRQKNDRPRMHPRGEQRRLQRADEHQERAEVDPVAPPTRAGRGLASGG